MKESNKLPPPRWATKFLNWYCKPALFEDLSGDLHEYFQRNVKSKGIRRAKLIYIIDVFKFLRPYTLRNPQFINLLINWIMLGSYIKTSGRSLMRNRLFSVINIAGLAVSLSVGLLLISVINDVFSYDDFHEHKNRIHRVTSTSKYLEHTSFMATTSLKAGKTIEESFSGIESVAILRQDFRGDLKWNEKVIPLSGFWANTSFFEVFSFEVVKGNPATVLKEPFSIVLTETSAKKLFGDEEALGKTIVFNNDKQYTITGIVKDIPVFSHMKFDMLGSLSTREIIAKDDQEEMKWENVWNTWVYLLLPEEDDTKTIQSSLDKLCDNENRLLKYNHVKLGLQPLKEIMTNDRMGNEIGPVMGKTLLWVFSGLSFVVILSACFNYTNLSIARSLRRTREVGIRKVIGALKSQVAGQFITESVVIALLSLVIALGLFMLVRPHFINIKSDLQQLLRLDLSLKLIVYFILFALVVGILAGSLPAMFFAKVNPVQVMKNFSSLFGFKKLTMRKVLIVFQFTISIILITSTLIIFKQYKHFITYDLGFNTDHVLNISLQGNKSEILKKELMELPEVNGISQSTMITTVGSYWGATMKYDKNPQDSATVWYNTVDENYLPLHNHKLLAGRNFSHRTDSAEESEVIVNEEVLKRFDIAGQNPVAAIGEIVNLNGKNLQIIGVIKDFRYGRPSERNSKEVIFRYANSGAQFLNVKITSDNILSTRKKIESIWKEHDPVHTFEAKFYDEQIEEAYSGLSASVKLAGFIAFLAICIASLGLLGMVVFTTETRLKEISIRKVLGASEGGLLYLLSKSFLLLLTIAISIALPVTLIFFEQVLLPEMGDYAPLSALDMLPGALGIMIIALAMIYSQTIKVAKTNPAEVLKNE